MSKKYQLIYADPPWAFSNQNTGGSMKYSAQAKYTVTSTEDLKRLDVNSIADDNCVLVMWYVGAMPQDAIDLVKSWGFTLKNMNGFVWNKLTVNNNPFFGMGFWTRAGSESAIIAIKGKPTPACRSVRAVGNYDPQSLDEVLAHLCYVGTYQNIRHSQKPDEFRDKCVELMGDVPRLEMFARTKTKGWDVFGNETVDSIDIPLKSAEQNELPKPKKTRKKRNSAEQLDIEDQIARDSTATNSVWPIEVMNIAKEVFERCGITETTEIQFQKLCEEANRQRLEGYPTDSIIDDLVMNMPTEKKPCAAYL
ncbi:MT-A70 family methyltransferase [Shewanella decolorationis]|uniref:MT-A70 family methyltransferase n=1 Tax=Shewanella decolorationis TaxID=256839 RepID=UPI001A9EA61E|nr:MT-A70 family methyltransferase [Shewanella decolorationis]